MHLSKNTLGSFIHVGHALGLATAAMTVFTQMDNQSN